MNVIQSSNIYHIYFLFDIIGRFNVYNGEGQRYRKDVGYGNFDAIALKIIMSR